MPSAWGKLVGFSNDDRLLEGLDQTQHIVDVGGKPPEFPRIKAR